MITAIDTVQNEGQGIAAQIETLEITDEASLQMAAALLQAAKSYIRKVEAVFDPVIASAMEALATARQQKQSLLGPAKDAEIALKDKIASFHVMLQDRQEEEKRRVIEATRGDEIVFVPPVETRKPKVKGLSIREDYKATVVDLMELVTAIACMEAPLEFVEPNYQAINKRARSLRESLNVPGVRVTTTNTVVSRA